MQTPLAPGPLPIVVGVTGHVDLRLEDVAPLTAAVNEVLAALKARYRHTRVAVLSPIAEGADRLVARAALDLGLGLIVAMPLDPEEYKKDFADAASIAEFEALRSKADREFVAPYGTGAPQARPDCYAHVGAYVARHCHLLLALWNGATTNKIGGTAEIVRHRIEGIATETAEFVRLLDATDTGVVYHIATPRRSDPSVVGVPFERRTIAPARYASTADAEEALDALCQSTDAFNAVAAETDARIEARRARSASYLLPAYAAAQLPPGLQAVRTLYAAADEAAIRFQERARWTVRSLFWLAFGIIVAFEAFAHGSDSPVHDEVTLLLYLILFLGGFTLYKWAEAGEVDMKYIDFRAFAESLRVEFYWRAAEVQSVAGDYCMRYRLEEMEWIRKGLRACELFAPMTWTTTPEASTAAVRAVIDDWVHGQHKYFGRAGRNDQRLLERLERRTKWFVGVNLLVALAVVVLTFRLTASISAFRDAHEQPYEVAVALIGLLPAAAALISGYAEQRGLSMHIKRYERMYLTFGAAVRVLDERARRGAWDQARNALAELGREALEENADWVMLHRERPLELPV